MLPSKPLIGFVKPKIADNKERSERSKRSDRLPVSTLPTSPPPKIFQRR
jgi:hypothetical protein